MCFAEELRTSDNMSTITNTPSVAEPPEDSLAARYAKLIVTLNDLYVSQLLCIFKHCNCIDDYVVVGGVNPFHMGFVHVSCSEVSRDGASRNTVADGIRAKYGRPPRQASAPDKDKVHGVHTSEIMQTMTDNQEKLGERGEKLTVRIVLQVLYARVFLVPKVHHMKYCKVHMYDKVVFLNVDSFFPFRDRWVWCKLSGHAFK